MSAVGVEAATVAKARMMIKKKTRRKDPPLIFIVAWSVVRCWRGLDLWSLLRLFGERRARPVVFDGEEDQG